MCRFSICVTRIIASLLGILLPVCIFGCAEPQHPWTHVPASTTQRVVWSPVPESKFRAVHWHENPEGLSRAVALLRVQPAVEISDPELGVLLGQRVHRDVGSATTHPAEGEGAYLVRGVAYGGFCSWCRVWTDSTGQSVWIHQGTWDGENLLSVLAMKPLEAPVIVYLPRKPSYVYVTALLAGDMIFRGMPREPPIPKHS